MTDAGEQPADMHADHQGNFPQMKRAGELTAATLPLSSQSQEAFPLFGFFGCNKDALEIEYSVAAARISMAGGSRKIAGPGWVDIQTIAEAVCKSTEEVSKAWAPLRTGTN